MYRRVIKNQDSLETKFIKKSYLPDPLPYQEVKTEWGNRKRKVSWNMQLKKQ